MSSRILLLLLAIASGGASQLSAQTDIVPYATEADLGKLIGQKATLEGIYHRDAFGAPAIAISGRVYYLLENPPSKRSFNFPEESRPATVVGTLYLYDGSIQYSELYDNVGKRYYFFSLADAKIQFGEPLKSRGESTEIVPTAKPSF